MRGVLLEVEGRSAVVLTPQGDFRRIPVPVGERWEIGDEVAFTEQRQAPWLRWGLAAAAAVLMLLVAPVGYSNWMALQPLAIVTVDINPSVQLTLNNRNQVIRAEALNADGEQILSGLDWSRQPVEAVISAVTEKAVSAGMLNPGDESSAVVVAVSPVEGKELSVEKTSDVLVKARSAAVAMVEEKAKEKQVEPKAQVAALAASTEERQEAKEKQISVGNLLILKQIQAVHPQATEQQIQNLGPGKLLKELKISPSSIFSQAEEENRADRKADKKDNKGSKSDEGGETRPASGQPQEKGTGSPGSPGKSDEKDSGKSDEKDSGSKEPGSKQSGEDKSKPSSQGKDGDKEKPARKDAQEQKEDPKPDKKPDNSGGRPNQQEEGKEKPGNQSKPNGKQDEKAKPREDEKEKRSSSDSWKIPFTSLEIPKPAFLRSDQSDKGKGSEEKGPRAETPGAGPSQGNDEKKVDAAPRPVNQPAGGSSDDPPKQEEPKQEEPKQKEPKQEEPKQKEPKQKEPKQEEPKQEEPKQEEPKQEEPKQEEPKQEEPKQKEPKQEEPKQKEPKQEEPKQEGSDDSSGQGGDKKVNAGSSGKQENPSTPSKEEEGKKDSDDGKGNGKGASKKP